MTAAGVATAPTAAGAGQEAPVDWVRIFLGFGGMVVGQFVAVLDIQIVASSLSQIQSGISASADEMSWVQTIYLLAEVVIIPLTAYLTRMFGTRNFYVVAACAFMASSIATGLSTSIEMMIVTRAIQGLAGGAMIPAVFATAMTVFPIERRVTANVVVGLIVTLAPTVGPTLGGHITEWLNWRWLFFINVPPCLLIIFLVWRYADFDQPDMSLAKGIDWWGVGLMTVALLSIQYVIEEGSKESWFKDDMILWLTVIGVITFVTFIWRQLTYAQPIVSLKPFQDRNFTLGIIMNFVSGASLFGGTFLMPLFMGQVLRYDSAQVGTTMLVSGLTMFLSAPLVGRFVRAMDPRITMFGGFITAAFGMGLAAHINPNWGFQQFMVMQIIRGVGVMVAMIAAQQMTVSTLPVHLMKDASGLVNLIRNVGGAVGLAVLATALNTRTAEHLADLSANLTITSQRGQMMIHGLAQMMGSRTSDPEGAAYKMFSFFLRREALALGYADAFYLMALGCAAAAVLGLFAAPAAPVPQAGPPGARPGGGGR